MRITLTTRQMVNRIIKTYHKSSEIDRFDWYGSANSIALKLAAKYSCSQQQAAGIIAALSPLKTWEMNLRLAEQFLSTGTAGHTGRQLAKCKAIMGTHIAREIADILGGAKTRAFFWNIYRPEDDEHITIDRHAICIALDKKMGDPRITAKQFEDIAEAYRIAAQKLGIPAVLLQSSTWEYWRRQK